MLSQNKRKRKDTKEKQDFIEKLVHVNRVAKVVKGGRRFAFAALVVVGDGKGKIGFASAKAKEVPDAVFKASQLAKKRMIRIPLKEGRTLHHDIVAKCGAGRVIMKSANAGTGVIAGGAMRAIFESLGVHDVVAKSIGSTNPHNLIRATLQGLASSSSPKLVALRRGKKVQDVLYQRLISSKNHVTSELQDITIDEEEEVLQQENTETEK